MTASARGVTLSFRAASVPNRSLPSKLYSTLAIWRSMFEALQVLARRRHCVKLTVASERPDTKFLRWLPPEVRWTNWKKLAAGAGRLYYEYWRPRHREGRGEAE